MGYKLSPSLTTNAQLGRNLLCQHCTVVCQQYSYELIVHVNL